MGGVQKPRHPVNHRYCIYKARFILCFFLSSSTSTSIFIIKAFTIPISSIHYFNTRFISLIYIIYFYLLVCQPTMTDTEQSLPLLISTLTDDISAAFEALTDDLGAAPLMIQQKLPDGSLEALATQFNQWCQRHGAHLNSGDASLDEQLRKLCRRSDSTLEGVNRTMKASAPATARSFGSDWEEVVAELRRLEEKLGKIRQLVRGERKGWEDEEGGEEGSSDGSDQGSHRGAAPTEIGALVRSAGSLVRRLDSRVVILLEK